MQRKNVYVKAKMRLQIPLCLIPICYRGGKIYTGINRRIGYGQNNFKNMKKWKKNKRATFETTRMYVCIHLMVGKGQIAFLHSLGP